MKRKTGKYKIPFRDGNQISYANEHWTDVEWKDNHIFEDTLELLDMERGRSAAFFNWRSVTTGVTYIMFMTDIEALLKGSTVSQGRVTGRWTFQKRGENYGIRPVFD